MDDQRELGPGLVDGNADHVPFWPSPSPSQKVIWVSPLPSLHTRSAHSSRMNVELPLTATTCLPSLLSSPSLRPSS